MTKLSSRLEKAGALLIDGAIGTNLVARGCPKDKAPELWMLGGSNEVHSVVKTLHLDFMEAGSELLLTNSWSANRFCLGEFGAAEYVREVNILAARLLRETAEAKNFDVIYGGSIGPTNQFVAPQGQQHVGAITFAQAREAFHEQAEALLLGGVDLIWIETMHSLDELNAAVKAVGELKAPYVCTMSFIQGETFHDHVTPRDAFLFVPALEPQPAAMGFNCGSGAPDLLAAMVSVSDLIEGSGVPFVAKGNCGEQRHVGEEIHFGGEAASYMARYARLALDGGARIIGGCCGSEPRHVAAMREELRTTTTRTPLTIERIGAELGTPSYTIGGN